MQSPLATLARRRHREKSGDLGPRGIFSGSEMHDMTQMMSSGTNERTNVDMLGATTAC